MKGTLNAWPKLVAVAAALVLALTACGEVPTSSAAASSFAPRGVTLRVFAAASLKATFTELAQEFENGHPGTTVSLNFGGSSDLVAQLQNGAPADVFASADEANMAKATAAGLASGTPRIFASNVLELAVPKGNPAGIHSLQDVAKPGVRLVVCAKQVPCGAAAQKAAASAGVALKPVSEEQSVADVLAKVTSGDADAGLVYVTDVKGAAGKVEGVGFPESSAAVNRYPIAALKQSKEAALAQAFVDFVGGESGRKVLGDAGFGAP
ncbi:molybdate ABC transporter substrate-binding protein [Sinomonas sp. JGH33]|uniref:Molybdate ABC transporter substrate-binding protein n=1 Tax=Sinomonas terricola TaxID=3110330 RepID=A0ABU5T659_9MICC|nr:molybdate ABC transporter substrate-binding protein [Sinomonas sp. JGH33]MEA5455078.1 molybdate ABC transporter substrate-binding protein [Sinomonas sp. JGH33]